MKGASQYAYGGAGPLILGISWGEALLATLILTTRAYGAIALERAGWDLFWSGVAWVTAFTAQAFITVGVSYGTGNHITNLDPHDIEESIKWGWVGQLIAIMAIGFGKVAVIALVLRVQGPTHKKKSYLLHFIWISNTIINIAQVVLLLYQCTPVQKLWNESLPGQCNGRVRAEYTGFFQGSWSAVSDFALAIYPIFVFWSLNISTKRKVGLCFLLGGGLLAAVAGTLKTIYIQLAPATEDVSYAIHPLIICACTEMWVIIIVGNIPQLRIVFVRLSRYSQSFLEERRSHRGGGHPAERIPSADAGAKELQDVPYLVGVDTDAKSQQRSHEHTIDIPLYQPPHIQVTTDMRVSYEDLRAEE